MSRNAWPQVQAGFERVSDLKDYYSNDAYSGYHCRPLDEEFPHFEVFSYKGQWYWSNTDSNCEQIGFREGPFNSAREAYYAAGPIL